MGVNIAYRPPVLWRPGTQSIQVSRTVTFDGGAGSGAVEQATMFTVSGHIEITALLGYIVTTCQSGGAATLALGVAGNATFFAGAVAVASLLANRWFAGGSMAVAIGRDCVSAGFAAIGIVTNDNITWSVGTAALTSGQVVFTLEYVPITPGAIVT